MALAPWLSPFSLPSSNLRSFSPSRRIPVVHLPWSPIPHLARRSLAPCCSAKKSGRGKASRKSNEELCAELREFISAKELPENRVPSLKFLYENGRKDLANLVRRRGVKLVTELLLNSNGENHSDKTSEGNQNSMNAHLCELAGGHKRNINVSPKYTLSSNNYSLEDMLKSNSAALTEHHVQVCEESKSSIDSLHLKAAKFIQTGELDTIEGSGEDCELHQDLAYKAEEDNQNDINHLKSLLHQKAMELSCLKQQIDDEKLVFSNMQVKAIAELGDIRRMTANKDAELQAAQENLNGLKEVHIDYWANGQIVEVAGSFNGWQHRVKMDLHPSPECTNSPGKPMLWSTVLWLYPGVYEIKFIIDGDWRIDSQREIITSGGITNNVLRVDR